MDALKKDSIQPSFTAAGDGPPRVELSEADYLELLVKGNVIDPASWPPAKQDGARLLARIREIEQSCIAQHGSWDWELLNEELQDEYDSACIDLSKLIEPYGSNWVTLEQLRKERGIEVQ